MKRHTNISDLSVSNRGASVAIGNFDGVHRGHQSVIDLARAAADKLLCPTGILTFEPHPRQFFAPDAPDFRLMNAEAKAHRLEKLDLAQLYELPFDSALAGLTALEFIEKILIEKLGVRHVVVGADFRFGKGRAGNSEMLSEAGRTHGFGTSIAPLVTDSAGDLSSTAIRAALLDGKPGEAARMLGHWHRIDGEVLHGEKRGRGLGFPTVNQSLAGLHLPKFGVYAVQVDIADGPHAGRYHGAASIGERPSFGINTPNIETFIFDFDGDLYGQIISVALVDYQRPELAFDDLAQLIKAIAQDCEIARKILLELSPIA